MIKILIKLSLLIINDKNKPLIRSALSNKAFYKKHKVLLLRIVNYYFDHKKFTEVQLSTLRRLLNG